MQLAAVPDWVGNLTALTTLDLRGNQPSKRGGLSGYVFDVLAATMFGVGLLARRLADVTGCFAP